MTLHGGLAELSFAIQGYCSRSKGGWLGYDPPRSFIRMGDSTIGRVGRTAVIASGLFQLSSSSAATSSEFQSAISMNSACPLLAALTGLMRTSSACSANMLKQDGIIVRPADGGYRAVRTQGWQARAGAATVVACCELRLRSCRTFPQSSTIYG